MPPVESDKKRTFMKKFIAIGTTAAVLMTVASVRAHGFFSVSIGIPPVSVHVGVRPPVFVAPPRIVHAPPVVVVPPRPVYAPPVYVAPPAYYAPRVVVVRPPHHHHRHHGHHHHHHYRH
jgi:hypothetical protein